MNKTNRIRSLGLAIMIVAGLSFTAARAHAFQYKWDDGTADDAIGYGNGSSNAGAIWLNGFTVSGGNNVINGIDVAWGFNGNSQINGVQMFALIYSDPNNDGNPIDGVLLASVAGTIQSAGTNTFVNYAMPSTTITGTSFFVGFYLPGFLVGGTQQFPVGFDETSPTAGVSWLSANSDGSEPDDTNLGNNDTNGTIEDFGLNGNWMIRADAVPEPSTWAMVAIGGVMLLGLMRYRVRLS